MTKPDTVPDFPSQSCASERDVDGHPPPACEAAVDRLPARPSRRCEACSMDFDLTEEQRAIQDTARRSRATR